MIGIIDYGSGNIQAIATIYKNLNIEHQVLNKPEDLKKAKKLILPGVGAFDATMQQLIDSGLKDELNKLVLEEKVPILGICVGLQVMGYGSEEGKFSGLGWIPGKVRAFSKKEECSKLLLPHMGWNTLDTKNSLLLSINENDSTTQFYFLHSYYFDTKYKSNVSATTKYGFDFDAVVSNKHIHGVQFHPEKSHKWGEKLLINFSKL